MHELHDVFITGIVFLSMYAIVKVIAENRLRNRLIDKGKLDENTKYLYSNFGSQPLSSLKWGFVLLGLGFALLLGQLVHQDVEDEVVVGGMFILAGAGLLAFYFVANQLAKRNKQE